MNDFVNELKQHNIVKALDTLYELGTGTRNTPKASVKNDAVNAVISAVKEKREILGIALNLAEINDPAAKEIAAHLLAFTYEENPVKVSNALKILANDENWEVREWVAGGCGEILSNHFNSFYKEMLDWTNDNSGNVRRAAALAAKYAGKTRKEEYAEPLLNLVERLLTDNDGYVKKNLGQFAIGDGLLRYYPVETRARMQQWIMLENENARWNIAKAFSTAEGMKHISESKFILQTLIKDDRYKVKRTVQSTLNKIEKKHPGLLDELNLKMRGTEMNHTMGLYEEYFTAIKNGRKTVEVRLNDEKRRKIRVGDTIEFTKLPAQDETLKVQVTALQKYETFREMYQDIPFQYFGSEEMPMDEMVEGTYDIYTPEQEARWGTLAIWIGTGDSFERA